MRSARGAGGDRPLHRPSRYFMIVAAAGLLVILAASAIFVADKYRKGEVRFSNVLSSRLYQFAYVEGHSTRHWTGRFGGNGY